ncbi:hypothetical protein Q8A73_000752 [Channa argus]|nr:hypothetical protein Q8A73_000752 [Channa argus]
MNLEEIKPLREKQELRKTEQIEVSDREAVPASETQTAQASVSDASVIRVEAFISAPSPLNGQPLSVSLPSLCLSAGAVENALISDGSGLIASQATTLPPARTALKRGIGPRIRGGVTD